MRTRKSWFGTQRLIGLVVCGSLAMATFSMAQNADIQKVPMTSHHQDYRQGNLKLEKNLYITVESLGLPADASDRAIAAAFLLKRSSEYRLNPSLSDLVFDQTQKSIGLIHLRYYQVYENIPVADSEVIVSLDAKSKAVRSAFNNYHPISNHQKSLVRDRGYDFVSKDRAFDSAWNDLKVHGPLQDSPKAQMKYRVSETGRLTLEYVTYLNVSAPFGAWQHRVDAYSGRVIERRDTRLERKPTKEADRIDPTIYRGPVADRQTAFERYERLQQFKTRQKALEGEIIRRDASALVFDPDPRTTLNNKDLLDDSAPELFDAAYVERPLRDLKFDGTQFILEGPWVKIGEFESPETAPSVNTTGKWTDKRGKNSFNDAMTYFMIDQSQRYIQSLGFTGEKGIQFGPIEVDTDGLSGMDNSHFIPGSNRLGFGHGCVDDNEDADVILHEYGHAINHSINKNFMGGDTGAIGEGFGDYWAGSYSISTAGGMAFFPNEVFSWDGHGKDDLCWPGRIMNADSLVYNPQRSYYAHQPIEGNRSSDELWSTPTFQALLKLIALGEKRDDVDRIILEAQFGMGHGITMREMATSIVATAQRLFPDRPFAKVFLDEFYKHEILETPQAKLNLVKMTIEGQGSNGVVDPSDVPLITVELKNKGTLNAEAISLKALSKTQGVTAVDGEYLVNDMAPSATGSNAIPLKLTIDPAIACGTKAEGVVQADYKNGLKPSAEFPYEFRIGKPTGIEQKSDVNKTIPDDSEQGLTTEMVVDAEGEVKDSLVVFINIDHYVSADLEIVLESPSGKKVVLHNHAWVDSLVGRYPLSLTPSESLDALKGEKLKGTWKLHVIDDSSGIDGTLIAWGLEAVTGYECQ